MIFEYDEQALYLNNSGETPAVIENYDVDLLDQEIHRGWYYVDGYINGPAIFKQFYRELLFDTVSVTAQSPPPCKWPCRCCLLLDGAVDCMAMVSHPQRKLTDYSQNEGI